MRTGAAELKAGRDLERLYARHKRDVYRFVLRDVRDPDEAEDITQTAFLDAFRALRRGDEPQQPQAWLLTIAQNAARRRFRARAARPSEVELDAELLAAPDREGPSADDIRLALERLRPAQREALVLREIGGRSYVEIAAAMAAGTATCRSSGGFPGKARRSRSPGRCPRSCSEPASESSRG